MTEATEIGEPIREVTSDPITVPVPEVLPVPEPVEKPAPIKVPA